MTLKASIWKDKDLLLMWIVTNREIGLPIRLMLFEYDMGLSNRLRIKQTAFKKDINTTFYIAVTFRSVQQRIGYNWYILEITDKVAHQPHFDKMSDKRCEETTFAELSVKKRSDIRAQVQQQLEEAQRQVDEAQQQLEKAQQSLTECQTLIEAIDIEGPVILQKKQAGDNLLELTFETLTFHVYIME